MDKTLHHMATQHLIETSKTSQQAYLLVLAAVGVDKPHFQFCWEGLACCKQLNLLRYRVPRISTPHWPGRLTESAPAQRNETVTSDRASSDTHRAVSYLSYTHKYNHISSHKLLILYWLEATKPRWGHIFFFFYRSFTCLGKRGKSVSSGHITSEYLSFLWRQLSNGHIIPFPTDCPSTTPAALKHLLPLAVLHQTVWTSS